MKSILDVTGFPDRRSPEQKREIYNRIRNNSIQDANFSKKQLINAEIYINREAVIEKIQPIVGVAALCLIIAVVVRYVGNTNLNDHFERIVVEMAEDAGFSYSELKELREELDARSRKEKRETVAEINSTIKSLDDEEYNLNGTRKDGTSNQYIITSDPESYLPDRDLDGIQVVADNYFDNYVEEKGKGIK